MSEPSNELCIGYLGADWWGSDARALAGELRRAGHLLVERHYEDYFPTRWRSSVLRAFRRLARPLMAAEYNRAIRELLDVAAMDFLLVFKGNLVRPETLDMFRKRGKAVYLVYPDVSFEDHGGDIWNCLPLYDCVFTTKSYHLEDARVTGRAQRIAFVPHGFDPDVHRPVHLRPAVAETYAADVSFVGMWSPKKEQILESLSAAIPNLRIRVWGPNWNQAGSRVKQLWQGRGAYGDELVAIYTASKINLGVLSEAGTGVREGDRTTARSWQIPACRAFMLHEDTDEIRAAFTPGEEIEVYSDTNDLALKVKAALENEARRSAIADAAFRRCCGEPYTYRRAADTVVAHHQGRVRSGTGGP